MVQKKHCADPWFSHIQNGIKKIEGRLWKKPWSSLANGDVITWFNDDRECISIVREVIRYPSFRDMLIAEGLHNILPGIKTVDDGVSVYREFFTENDEETLGVAAIHLYSDDTIDQELAATIISGDISDTDKITKIKTLLFYLKKISGDARENMIFNRYYDDIKRIYSLDIMNNNIPLSPAVINGSGYPLLRMIKRLLCLE